MAENGSQDKDKTKPQLVTRHSIQLLQRLYDDGYKEPLEDVILAFRGIMKLPHDNKYSFFNIGGYHGAPFEKRNDAGDKKYWGGYCNHGNILFPTWHRAYCAYLEKALQSIIPNVGLPYLDQTSRDMQEYGFPTIFTTPKVEIRGVIIDNPLYSYKLQAAIKDDRKEKDINNSYNYSKPQGYETVRYPYSGLVGTEQDKKNSKAINEKYSNDEATKMLNDNFIAWLAGINEEKEEVFEARADKKDLKPRATSFGLNSENKHPTKNGLQFQYLNCLNAPNYTVFSNKSSTDDYYRHKNGYVFSLESPHDGVHLAIGGKSISPKKNFGQVGDANGDMGENNTSGLDPIFYFHHAFIDRVFWLWQQRHGFTDDLEIDDSLSGTKTSNSPQGPSAGQKFDEKLTLDSPLYPFKNNDGTYMTSRDVINIEKLGFVYGPGSLEEHREKNHPLSSVPEHEGCKLLIEGIHRDKFVGSFVIMAFMKLGDGTKEALPPHAVFSRVDIEKCDNCQSRMNMTVILPLGAKSTEHHKAGSIVDVEVIYHAKDATGKRDVMIKADMTELKWEIIL